MATLSAARRLARVGSTKAFRRPSGERLRDTSGCPLEWLSSKLASIECLKKSASHRVRIGWTADPKQMKGFAK